MKHPAEVDVAVLILFFTRPEPLRQVFNAIRKARPSKLYLRVNPGVSQASAGRSRPGGLDSVLAPHGGRGPGQVCLRAQSTAAHHRLRFS